MSTASSTPERPAAVPEARGTIEFEDGKAHYAAKELEAAHGIEVRVEASDLGAPDAPQRLFDPTFLVGCQAQVGAYPQSDVLRHRQMGKEIVVLKDHADRPR